MRFNPLRAFFSQPAGPVPSFVIGEILQRQAEASVQSYGGRYYHTVTLPEGKTFEDLQAAFKDVGFTPRPRHGSDFFVGLGYDPDNETGTARILADKKHAQALSERGYQVSLDVPPIQPARLAL